MSIREIDFLHPSNHFTCPTPPSLPQAPPFRGLYDQFVICHHHIAVE